MTPAGRAESREDFGVCPHCWHLNGPMSRICIRCRADTSLLLQESGGERWAAPAQSPMPILRGRQLSRGQRLVLFGFLVIFGLGQLLAAVAPRAAGPAFRSVPSTP